MIGRRIGLAGVACVLCVSPLFAQKDFTLLGFERGSLGPVQRPWLVPTAGWQAELSEEFASEGRRSAKLFLPGQSEARFGNLMISFPGEPFAGRHVTLVAKIRVVGEGQGQMWLRADRPGGVMGAFDNMQDRPILPGAWKEAQIDATIEPDAIAVNFGFMAGGAATLYIDEVKFRLMDGADATQAASAPKALSPRGLVNLTAAAELLSYVRFFHPSDEAVAVASWDHFAVDMMERCESPRDAKALAQRLRESIADIAPTVEVWAGRPEDVPPLPPVPANARKAAMWRHFGAGTVSQNPRESVYQSTVEKLALDQVPGGMAHAFVVKDLGGGVCCRVPIAVPVDNTGTLPHSQQPSRWASKLDLRELSARNRSTRLAGVALSWGVFQHFYPYFDVVKVDWRAALPAALAKTAEDTNERDYLATLRAMVAKLHDGHGGVYNPRQQARSFLPLALEWAGDALVVVGKAPGAPDSVEIGDTVLAIDRQPVRACYEAVSKCVSAATDGWRRNSALGQLALDFGTRDPVEFALAKPNGREFKVKIARARGPVANTVTTRRPANGATVSPGIAYFDLSGTSVEALMDGMPQLEAAKGIIFDLRGYPDSAAMALMRHLIDQPATSIRMAVPVVRWPDQQQLQWQDVARWDVQPLGPRLKAKLAFLTDGRAISYAESIMGMVEHYKFGEIVGSNTAGTNGNVNPFALPGGCVVYWTGMRVLKHDGSQHHGIGIAPTVPVTPTAKGIARGHDEVLEKAIEVLKAQIEPRPQPKR